MCDRRTAVDAKIRVTKVHTFLKPLTISYALGAFFRSALTIRGCPGDRLSQNVKMHGDIETREPFGIEVVDRARNCLFLAINSGRRFAYEFRALPRGRVLIPIKRGRVASAATGSFTSIIFPG